MSDFRRCVEADEHFPSQRHPRSVCPAPSVVHERLHEEAREYARGQMPADVAWDEDFAEAVTDAYMAGFLAAQETEEADPDGWSWLVVMAAEQELGSKKES